MCTSMGLFGAVLNVNKAWLMVLGFGDYGDLRRKKIMGKERDGEETWTCEDSHPLDSHQTPFHMREKRTGKLQILFHQSCV